MYLRNLRGRSRLMGRPPKRNRLRGAYSEIVIGGIKRELGSTSQTARLLIA